MRLITAYLYVTLRCNARCQFCTIWSQQDHAGPDLSLETGFSLLADLRRLGVRHVDFTGGEPTLYSSLPALLRYARGLGLFTSMTTNGLLYQERAGELSGLLDSLGFSLNGPTEDVHDGIHGVSSFQHTLESLKLARSLGEPVHAHFTATNTTVQVLGPTLGLARELDIPLIVFPEFSYFGNSRLAEQHLNVLSDFACSPGICLNKASLRFQQQGGNDINRPICRAGRSALAVGPDGTLILPCFHSKQQVIPTNGALYDTYMDPAVQHLLGNSGRYDFCQGCTNWCYINPSFVCSLNRFTAPHLVSAFHSLRLIYREDWLLKMRDIMNRRLAGKKNEPVRSV